MKKLLGTAAIMVVASGIWVSASLAQSTSGFVLHVTEASYSGCNTIGADESGITCDVIDIEGDGAAPNGQFVFVLAFGFNSTNIPGWGGAADAGIAGAQFGITYDDAADPRSPRTIPSPGRHPTRAMPSPGPVGVTTRPAPTISRALVSSRSRPAPRVSCSSRRIPGSGEVGSRWRTARPLSMRSMLSPPTRVPA